MTRNNWILFGASLLVLLGVLYRNASRHRAEKREHRVYATTYEIPATNSFGYLVIVDADTVLSQPNIPSIPGRQPFASQADAQKTGDLAAQRLAKRPFELPIVSPHDLDSMGIKH